MGKIMRNGVQYGVDTADVLSTVAECDASASGGKGTTQVASAKALSELNSNFNDNINELSGNFNDRLGGFQFKTENGKKQVSTDGGDTWENFNIGAELIWTNPAPLNSFYSQTISLDLSSYDAIILTIKGPKSAISGTVRRSVHSKGISSVFEAYPYSTDIVNKASEGWYGNITVYDDKIVFNKRSDFSDNLIPLTIHGIKCDDFASANF